MYLGDVPDFSGQPLLQTVKYRVGSYHALPHSYAEYPHEKLVDSPAERASIFSSCSSVSVSSLKQFCVKITVMKRNEIEIIKILNFFINKS